MGILNAFFSNLGAYIVNKGVRKLRLRSKHIEDHTAVFLMYLLMYLNAGLMPLIPLETPKKIHFIPFPFTTQFLLYFGSMIGTAMVLSNMAPYFSPVF